MQFSEISKMLMFAPFFVAISLVVLGMFSAFTGIGPASNNFAVSALAAIAVGLLAGVISLFFAKPMWVWWRVLAGVLYIPTTIFSLLAAGF